MRRRTTRWSIAGALVLVGSLAGSASILAVSVSASATTYATSPVPYDVDAVARGAARFAHECSRCHGADARGTGEVAATLAVKPANLAEHALHHPQGNLFGWIAHGVPGSPMPAFSPQLSDREIWELVQFIVARASAEAARSLGPRIDAGSTSRAPDFAYEVRGEGRRTLMGERKPALLVLDSADASDARLARLASDTRLARAGVRVIPIPLRAASEGRIIVGRDVADVYRMFAEANGTASGEHVELLVDGKGILRARWTGVPSAGSDRDAEIAAALQRLRLPTPPPADAHHHHYSQQDAGLVARMKALTILPSTSRAAVSTSTPCPARKVAASSTP